MSDRGNSSSVGDQRMCNGMAAAVASAVVGETAEAVAGAAAVGMEELARGVPCCLGRGLRRPVLLPKHFAEHQPCVTVTRAVLRLKMQSRLHWGFAVPMPGQEWTSGAVLTC